MKLQTRLYLILSKLLKMLISCSFYCFSSLGLRRLDRHELTAKLTNKRLTPESEIGKGVHKEQQEEC